MEELQQILHVLLTTSADSRSPCRVHVVIAISSAVLHGGLSVERNVGYLSVWQFSREYSRVFGESHRREVSNWEAVASHDVSYFLRGAA